MSPIGQMYQDRLKKLFVNCEVSKEDKKVKLYNVHRRTLPVGEDRVVAIGFTKEDAKWFVTKRLKAKEKFINNDDGSKGSKLVYYDIVAQDATSSERSVYFNPRPFVLEQ